MYSWYYEGAGGNLFDSELQRCLMLTISKYAVTTDTF